MNTRLFSILLAAALILPSCDWDDHYYHSGPGPAPRYHGHTGFRNNFRPAPPPSHQAHKPKPKHHQTHKPQPKPHHQSGAPHHGHRR